jgi:hypothetical protein
MMTGTVRPVPRPAGEDEHMPDIDPDDVPHPKLDKADPDVGIGVTIDSDGNVRKVDVDVHVPGTADGSDPAHYQIGGHDPSDPAKQPGWSPTPTYPSPAEENPLPVPTGWHRDPKTGYDLPGPASAYEGAADPGSMSEPGDYEPPTGEDRIG